MTIPENLSGKITLTLFALVFAVGFSVGGVAAGVLPVYKQISGWWQARTYVPVSASVVSAKLESRSGKSTTYRAVAEFRYEYEGRSYSSHALDLSSGGSDNISDYQENLFQQLQQARNNAAPVTLWVNPRQPAQAVYNRSIRWMMVIFLIPFALLFPAVGLGAWWVIWRIWTHKEHQLSNESGHAASGPLLIQGDRAGLIGLAFMSAFWNLLSWPMAIVFLASAHAAPWWVSLLVSIFPSIGLVLLFTLWKAMRAQWRIGKPALVLTEAGVPGSFPLQGQIQFDPALGLRLDAGELTHDVSVSVEYVRENRRGKHTEVTPLWHGQAVQTQLARGAERLNFKMDLPAELPSAAAAGSSLIREYWQVVLETLGGKVNFRIPAQAVSLAKPAVLHETQVPHADARALRLVSRMRRGAQAVTYLFVGYFVWIAVTEFAIPMYRSAQDNSAKQPPSALQTSPADRPQLPEIRAPFLLDSLSGNGFGVVARAAGKMEIGDNTIQLYPESIELRSYGSCASDCPVIHAVEFTLTRAGRDSFSTVAESVPIPVRQNLPDIANLAVSVPAGQLPIRLNFTDREQLAGLRLTLEIRGELMSAGKLTEVSWYTHVEPFAAALGQEPARLVLADDVGQRQMQAQQAVLAGRSGDLQQLLQAGVDANSRDAGGETMLMRAANRGDLNSVKLLLAHGAQVNASTVIDKDGNGAHTALHAAMRQDAVNVVDALIKAGANPMAEANQVWTPMHYAAYRGAVQSIRYLHQHGVSIDEPFKGARGSTPLMLAAQYEQVPTIRLLLELGADQKRKDIYGEDSCGYARFFNKSASKEALGCK